MKSQLVLALVYTGISLSLFVFGPLPVGVAFSVITLAAWTVFFVQLWSGYGHSQSPDS